MILMNDTNIHRASIPYKVNIEIGASYIVDPLLAIDDNRCQFPQ